MYYSCNAINDDVINVISNVFAKLMIKSCTNRPVSHEQKYFDFLIALTSQLDALDTLKNVLQPMGIRRMLPLRTKHMVKPNCANNLKKDNRKQICIYTINYCYYFMPD